MRVRAAANCSLVPPSRRDAERSSRWRAPGPPAPPMRDFAHSLPMALLKAREAVMAGFRPDLEAHDLTEQQWRVLRILTEHPGITMGDLAERAALLRPSLSRIVGRLEERALIERAQEERDLRRARLTMTMAGRRLRPGDRAPVGAALPRHRGRLRPGPPGRAAPHARRPGRVRGRRGPGRRCSTGRSARCRCEPRRRRRAAAGRRRRPARHRPHRVRRAGRHRPGAGARLLGRPARLRRVGGGRRTPSTSVATRSSSTTA